MITKEQFEIILMLAAVVLMPSLTAVAVALAIMAAKTSRETRESLKRAQEATERVLARLAALDDYGRPVMRDVR